MRPCFEGLGCEMGLGGPDGPGHEMEHPPTKWNTRSRQEGRAGVPLDRISSELHLIMLGAWGLAQGATGVRPSPQGFT